jgi:hypothetical protein
MELTKSEKINISTTDIAKRIRAELKTKYPACKFSIRTHYFSGGSSIDINLMAGNFPVIDADKVKEVYDKDTRCSQRHTLKEVIESLGHHQINHYYIDTDTLMTDKAKEMFTEVVRISNQYNYNDSDIQSDYFSVRFYASFSIGKWDNYYVNTADKK